MTTFRLKADMVFTGSTPACIIGAVAYARRVRRAGLTRRILMFDPTYRPGGIISNGMPATDYGTAGGQYQQSGYIAELYNMCAAEFGSDDITLRPNPAVFERNVRLLLGRAGVELFQRKAVQSVTLDSSAYITKATFVDLDTNDTYVVKASRWLGDCDETDFMQKVLPFVPIEQAVAGGPNGWTYGRESEAAYGEPYAGFGKNLKQSIVSGYRADGETLRTGVIADPGLETGAADYRVMNSNIRPMWALKANGNAKTLTKPKGYDELLPELMWEEHKVASANKEFSPGTPIAGGYYADNFGGPSGPVTINGALSAHSPATLWVTAKWKPDVTGSPAVGEIYRGWGPYRSVPGSLFDLMFEYQYVFRYMQENHADAPGLYAATQALYGIPTDILQETGGYSGIYVREAGRLRNGSELTQLDAQGRVGASSVLIYEPLRDSSGNVVLVDGVPQFTTTVVGTARADGISMSPYSMDRHDCGWYALGSNPAAGYWTDANVLGLEATVPDGRGVVQHQYGMAQGLPDQTQVKNWMPLSVAANTAMANNSFRIELTKMNFGQAQGMRAALADINSVDYAAVTYAQLLPELVAIGHVYANGNWPTDAIGGWEWQVANAA